IGLVGNTGNSTGSHLHIELLINGERLNPIFYLETGEGAGFGGNEYTSEAAQRLLNEAARYLGTPYVWGGYSPSGFDCSGFVSYCLTNSGVRNTGRLTAQGLYNICTPVSQSEA
ncbi:NlpC/P60 family protein, partial [Anaerosalibacter bizertensis]|nr:NlpC/P60 family protein [Anaerosalibacter bizertensis]